VVEVLGLENGENISSVLVKLEDYAGKYLAVIPNGAGDVLRNPVNVRLLQRRAEDLGMLLAVISNDEFTAWLCHQAGIATFTNLHALENAASGGMNLLPDFRKLLRLGRWVSSGAALAVLVCCAVVVYLVVPAASVTVVPRPQTLGLQVNIAADTQQNDVNTADGRIPAKFVTAESEGDQDVAATGLRDQPDQSATGIVTFTNKTDQPVVIPKQTVVGNGKVTFATSQDSTVPATIKDGDLPAINGIVRIPVVAVAAGPDSNLAARAVNSVTGDVASKVSVTNELPIAGGTTKKQPYLTGDDQAKVRGALRQQLVGQAANSIKQQMGPSQTLLLDDASQGDGAIEEVTFSQSPEQVQTSTRVHMRVLVRGLTFLGDDVNAVVDNAIRDAVSARGSSVQLLPDPLKIDPPAITNRSSTTVDMSVRASGQVVTRTDANQIADDLRGLDLQSAKRLLATNPGLQQASIEIWPGFDNSLPRFAWRIRVDVLRPNGSSTG
jgi:hypothetical protein